ncbi:MAG: MFS transporter [Desulfobulbaceae bacterium]|uniref:MFS transporter n=1 Tax=Candidatus Desulfatifera sulfidica TaxID=2841691 RepID=A0A8J6T9V5_9BACT|nr:MFS transporter [Candidatus Desulfatifera sulfidica]
MPPSTRWPLFILVATGVLLSTMDSSMINVALPVIMAEFGVRLAAVQWVVLIYLLTITSSLLFWGRLGDRLGAGRIYLAGMLVFALGSLACSLSLSLVQLILFRLFQGLGAAMMMANGPAMIRLAFPVESLGRMLGLIGVVTSVGLMTGPLVSGALIHYFSWRMMFLATLPVSCSGLVLSFFYLLPALRQSGVAEDRPAQPFDWVGLLLWTLLVLLLVSGASVFQTASSTGRLLGGLLTACLLVVFLRHQRRAVSPFLPLDILAVPRYGLALLAAAISFAVLFVVLILTPFYLHHILRFDPRALGLVMMSVPAAVFVVAPLAGLLHDRVGARIPATSGLLICAAALLLLSRLSLSASLAQLIIPLMLLGCGQALFLSPNSAAVLGHAAPEQGGIMSGLLATSRNLGMLCGTALAGLVFASFFAHLTGGLDVRDYSPAQADAFIRALRYTFLLTAGLSLVGVVVSVRRGEGKG